jgi:mycothiol synthase
MSSSPADTITLRGGTPGDAAIVAAVLNAEERGLRGTSQWTVEGVRDWWPQAQATWIAEVDETPVGFAAVLVRDDLFDVWAAVDPAVAGRGLSAELLRRGETCVRELGGTQVHAATLGENDAAHALLTACGYRAVRRYYRMLIELAERPRDPDWPDGITPTSFHREDARAFYDALVDAFADEWHWRPLPYDEWVAQRVDAPDATPDLWTLARDGDEVAGVVRCDVQGGHGWIGNVGVRARWRRRGLGHALLLRAFARFYDRGIHSVRLGVDAANSSGATRLYERAGMHVEAEDVVYEKELI